jgi:Xaa-Pro aminopeptidase
MASTITEKGSRRVSSLETQWWSKSKLNLFMNSCTVQRFLSYTPIIGSGNNANVLHYIENNQQCKSGDLILIDAAEYANYSSDMTCTIPVSGTMTDKKSRLQCCYALKMLLKCLFGKLCKQ